MITLTLKLGAVVGGYGVEDNEANVVTFQQNGDLVMKDVVLGFQIGQGGAQDIVERGAVGKIYITESLVDPKHLRKAGRGQARLG
jgi:hypothetical protein